MKLETALIRQKLKELKPAFDPSDTLRIGAFVYLSNKLILANNERIQIYSQLEIESEDFECALPVKEFSAFIAKVKDTELTFEKTDTKVTIKGKKVKLHIVEDEGILARLKQFEIKEFDWFTLPSNFIAGLELCIPAASKEPTILNKVLIRNEHIFATDGYRASQFTLEDSMESDIFIPLKACIQIVKYDFVKYYVEEDTDSIYLFSPDNSIVFSARLEFGDYVDVEKNMNAAYGEGTDLILPAEITDHIDLSSIMLDEVLLTDKIIAVEIKEGLLKLNGFSNTGGVEIETNYTDIEKNIKFDINPIFFSEILNITKKLKILESVAVFKTDNFIHFFGLED